MAALDAHPGADPSLQWPDAHAQVCFWRDDECILFDINSMDLLSAALDFLEPTPSLIRGLQARLNHAGVLYTYCDAGGRCARASDMKGFKLDEAMGKLVLDFECNTCYHSPRYKSEFYDSPPHPMHRKDLASIMKTFADFLGRMRHLAGIMASITVLCTMEYRDAIVALDK